METKTPNSLKQMKIILNSASMVSNSGGLVRFIVNIPNTIEKYNLLKVQSFYCNTAFLNQINTNSYFNVHLKNLYQPNTFSTNTRGLTDVILTSSTNQNFDLQMNNQAGIPLLHNNFLQNSEFVVQFSNGKMEPFNNLTIDNDNCFQITLSVMIADY